MGRIACGELGAWCPELVPPADRSLAVWFFPFVPYKTGLGGTGGGIDERNLNPLPAGKERFGHL